MESPSTSERPPPGDRSMLTLYANDELPTENLSGESRAATNVNISDSHGSTPEK